MSTKPAQVGFFLLFSHVCLLHDFSWRAAVALVVVGGKCREEGSRETASTFIQPSGRAISVIDLGSRFYTLCVSLHGKEDRAPSAHEFIDTLCLAHCALYDTFT